MTLLEIISGHMHLDGNTYYHHQPKYRLIERSKNQNVTLLSLPQLKKLVYINITLNEKQTVDGNSSLHCSKCIETLQTKQL
jgi:hypothetical protein